MKDFNVVSNQKLVFTECLKQGLRLNGRSLEEAREPKLHISSSEFGFVEVEWGLTKLTVRVSAEVCKPYEDRPFEGLFSINTELSLMANLSFENGKTSDEEVLVSRLIEKAVRRSNALDLESLCIVAGEKVWSIRATINFISDDGGLIDASCLGVMTALQHFRKPDVSIRGTEVIFHSTTTHQPTPLSILHIPLCLTYSFFNPQGDAENIKGSATNEIAILDADKAEELLRDGSLVLTMNMNRELIQISKNGGLPIDGTILLQLARDGLTSIESFTTLMKDALTKNHETRYHTENLELLEVGADR